MGDCEPEKVCDKFQFSSRASTKTETTRSARLSIGEESEANTRAFEHPSEQGKKN